MGWRFRRSVKIAPGIRLNVGSRSASVRFGPKGLGYTVGTKGSRVSASIPGTGISYSQKLPSAQPSRLYAVPSFPNGNNQARPSRTGAIVWLLLIGVMLGWCVSRNRDLSTSTTLSVPPTVPEVTQNAQPSEAVGMPKPAAPVPLLNKPMEPRVWLYTKAAVRLRAAPSTDAQIVMTVPSGAKVSALSTDGQWHYVKYGSRNGWMHGNFLDEGAPATPTQKRVAKEVTPFTAPPARARSNMGQPAREPVVGRCDCPYDRMRNGRRCGGNSAYSKPGGRNPVCYL